MSLLSTSQFDNFNSSRQYVFNVRDLPSLKIKASCPIGVFKGDADKIIVEIDADEETSEEFQVNQTGNTINIVQKPRNFDGNVVIGTTVISSGGQNIQIVNGRVYINGKEVTTDGSTGVPRSLPKVRITAPYSDLNATLAGDSLIVSTVPLKNTFLLLSGIAKADIPTYSLDLDISGSADIKALLGGGELNINVSGSSSIDIQGCWTHTNINLSGMGNVQTCGNCTGNYSVNASGMGAVNHVGTIAGFIRKSVSGMARINI